jgi:hypothetical protein
MYSGPAVINVVDRILQVIHARFEAGVEIHLPVLVDDIECLVALLRGIHLVEEDLQTGLTIEIADQDRISYLRLFETIFGKFWPTMVKLAQTFLTQEPFAMVDTTCLGLLCLIPRF